MDLITALPAKARTFVDDSPWLALGTAVVLVLITRMLAQTVRSRAVASRLASRARMKRAARDAKRAARDVPALLAALPDAARCDEILALTATELRDALRDRNYTSVEVTTLYIARCIAITERINCITEDMFEEALEAARDSDVRLQSGDASLIRPLEGLPMSTKENYLWKGYDSTCGLAAKTFRPAKADGLLLARLRQNGVVLLGKTNVPQCMMLPESDNRVWGASSNPWNTARTPGGSSGGEAALLAARGAPLGVGGDIGGSLRIPASFCGLYTMKVTPQRLTHRGIQKPRPTKHVGQEHIIAVSGPMGRCVEDLLLVLRDCWMTPEVWAADPRAPPIPFDMARFSLPVDADNPLVVGYYENDGWFQPHPACARAVRDAVTMLRGVPGVRLVPFKLPNSWEAARLFYGILSADGNMRGFKAGLEGEALHPMYHQVHRMATVPSWLRNILIMVLRATGKRRPAHLLNAGRPKSAAQLWDFVRQRKDFESEVEAAWRGAGLDVLLTPSMGMPAFSHGASRELTPAVSYCFAWNVLHYPVGVVPMGRVRAEEGTTAAYEAPLNQQDLFEAAAKRQMKGSEGLPVGVQVVAEPWQDEKCLRAMALLQRCLAERASLAGHGCVGCKGDVTPQGTVDSRGYIDFPPGYGNKELLQSLKQQGTQ